MTDQRTTAAALRAEIEAIVQQVLAAQSPRLVRRVVAEVQSAKVKGRGGTCTVVDGLGNTTYGVRWYETRPRRGDLVLVEVPPPGGTRRIVAIDREVVAAGAGAALAPGTVSQTTKVDVQAGNPHRDDDTTSFFPVAAYGAVGDGSADDTVALQDAIDAAATAGGGIVLCMPGAVHLTSGQVVIRSSGVTLDLNGATIRRANTLDATTDPVVEVGADPARILKSASTADSAALRPYRVTVRNGTVDANAKALYAVRVRSAAFATLDTLAVSGGTTWQVLWDALYDAYGTDLSTTHCTGRSLQLTGTGSQGGMKLTSEGWDGIIAISVNRTTRSYFEDVSSTVASGDAVYLEGAYANTFDGLETTCTLGVGRGVVLAGSADAATMAALGNQLYNVRPSDATIYALGGTFPSRGNYAVLSYNGTATISAGATLGYVIPPGSGSTTAMRLGSSVLADGLLQAAAGLQVAEQAAPATPGSGWYHVYAKVDGKLYGKNDSGTEVLLGAAIGSDVQAWDADLDALAALGSTGFAVRTAANTWAQRTLTTPNDGLAVTAAGGVGANPAINPANDLAALEALTGTGVPTRTGTEAWAMGAYPDIQIFNATGTWTKPTVCSYVYVIVVGAGGGGASGRRGAAGTARFGGGGGGGGAVIDAPFVGSALGATVAVTVGTAGTGGAAAAADSTDGTNGGDGGFSNFSTARASGGIGGVGGSAAGGSSGAGGSSFGTWPGARGGDGASGAGSVGNSAQGGGGGGGGGGISAGNVAGATGGDGGTSKLNQAGGTGAVVAGAVIATAGTQAGHWAGTGGGGGAFVAGTGVRTGKAGGRGAGGGGGSASLNGAASGAGGDGGAGYVVVISY